MHANRPDLLENGVLILHDNTRPHIDKVFRELLDRYSREVLPHPPYSPDMSPPNFDLSQKLKINMRGVRFSTLEDLYASVTRRVIQLNCSTGLTGTMDLPKRWDAVIRQKGATLFNVRQTLRVEVSTAGLNNRANSESEISYCIRTHGSDLQRLLSLEQLKSSGCALGRRTHVTRPGVLQIAN